MAKVIKYNLCTVVDCDDGKKIREVLTPVTLVWSEANEELAKMEAQYGEYTIEDDGVEKKPAEQIAKLKKELSATDYKVIKCSECQLLGKEMPYDVSALHAERQAIRDQINQIEQEE